MRFYRNLIMARNSDYSKEVWTKIGSYARQLRLERAEPLPFTGYCWTDREHSKNLRGIRDE